MGALGLSEQIHTDNFLKFCDYIYSPRENYDYVLQCMQKHTHLKMFSPNNPLKEDGIIFVGMCVLIEECFQLMPTSGNYVIIHRDNERAFTEAFYKLAKPSVKHIYTIECAVKYPNVTAMPFGTASIGGDSESLVQVQNEPIEKGSVPVFCRLNTNKFTKVRTEAVRAANDNPLITVFENQLDSVSFFRMIKGHRFNLSLQSGGKDTTRTWETIFLGTIPIISDCIELRHFEDMPVAYYPEGGITQEWINSVDMTGKSLERCSMTYWREQIIAMKYD